MQREITYRRWDGRQKYAPKLFFNQDNFWDIATGSPVTYLMRCLRKVLQMLCHSFFIVFIGRQAITTFTNGHMWARGRPYLGMFADLTCQRPISGHTDTGMKSFIYSSIILSALLIPDG